MYHSTMKLLYTIFSHSLDAFIKNMPGMQTCLSLHSKRSLTQKFSFWSFNEKYTQYYFKQC